MNVSSIFEQTGLLKPINGNNFLMRTFEESYDEKCCVQFQDKIVVPFAKSDLPLFFEYLSPDEQVQSLKRRLIELKSKV